jgi:hypothetical protein
MCHLHRQLQGVAGVYSFINSNFKLQGVAGVYSFINSNFKLQGVAGVYSFIVPLDLLNHALACCRSSCHILSNLLPAHLQA